MPENDSRNSNSPTPHKLEHISRIIRQQYPELHQANETLQRRQRMLNQSIVIATCIVLVATPAAIHLFASEKLLAGLAALVSALGAAFAPKIYVDFIQPNRSQAPATRDD